MPDKVEIPQEMLERCARTVFKEAFPTRDWDGYALQDAWIDNAKAVIRASGLLAENAALKARVAELEGLVRVEYCKISCRYSHVGFGGDADTPCDPRCPVEQALNGGAGK